MAGNTPFHVADVYERRHDILDGDGLVVLGSNAAGFRICRVTSITSSVMKYEDSDASEIQLSGALAPEWYVKIISFAELALVLRFNQKITSQIFYS